MHVVQVASCLQGGVAKAEKGPESIVVAVLLNIPAWRFRAEVHANHKRNGWDESGAKLKTPGDVAGVGNGKVGAETEEDTESCPHLPTHDQTATDDSRHVLSSVNGDDRGFSSHANTEEKTSNKQLLPVLGKAGADHGDQAEDGGEEDCTAATEVVVKRIR